MSTLSPGDLEAVRRHLSGAGVDVGPTLTARQIAGGRSNLTYAIGDGRSQWVLRRPPIEGATPSAHDMAREFRVTSALAATDVPVAQAYVLCEDVSVLGAPFTVVEFVTGSTLRTSADIESIGEDLLSEAVDHLVDALASLHAVDYESVGLGGFGRPDAYAERQVRRWSGQWEIVGDDASGRAEALAGRLRRTCPPQVEATIVHGDFRCDNTLVDLDDGGRVRAIVDWELSTIGDPVADVALMCAYRHPALDLALGFESAWTSSLLPGRDELAAAYERRSGRVLHHWEFHLALAYFKLAVIAAGIEHRHRLASSSSRPGTAATAVGRYLDAGLAVGDQP